MRAVRGASRHAWIASAAFAAALGFAAAPAAARGAEATAWTFDIPARDLAGALRAFGDASDTQILFSKRLVAGRRSPAVQGRFSEDEALRRLLADTGLTWRRTKADVILVTEPKIAAAPRVERIRLAQPGAGSSRLATEALAPAVVEEVIVTSGKRPEKAQEVPASVLVVTAAALERSNIRDFDDLVSVAPSVTITKTSQPANNSINIRGIGTHAFSIATEPSVAVVIDDIPQAFQAAAFAALVDVQQVEVLRGPQNTLFGKAASAGVVSVTTQPATDTFTARVDALVTGDGEHRLAGTLSGPITDTLKFRLAAHYSDYRGNIYNLSTGAWLNGNSDTTLRGKLVWEPSPDWSVTLSPYIIRTLASCCVGAQSFLSPGVTAGRNHVAQSTALAGITVGPDSVRTRMDVNARGNALDYGSGLKVTRRLGDYTLDSISSYDRYDLYDRQDTDSTDIDFSQFAPTAPRGGSANGGYFKINSVTQELRLTSHDRGRLTWVGGFFYSQTNSQRHFVRGSNTLGDFNGLTSLPTTNGTAYSAYLSRAEAVNYAAFGQGAFKLTDGLDLLAGLRVNREKIGYTFQDLGNRVTYGSPECATTSPTLAIETCSSDTSVTGRVGLRYRFSPDIMAFATYSRGYKGLAYDLTSTLTTRTLLATGPLRGVPVADAVAARQPVAPETVDNYEVGIKASLFHRRLTWNVTAFNMIFEGFQAQSRDLITNQNLLNSIGRVTSRGVETELAAVVGEHLTLNASGAYNRATLNDFPNANCYGFQTAAQGCVGGQQNLSGKPLPNAPRWNANIGGQYDAPLDGGRGRLRGFLQATARWQSKVIFNLLQDPTSVQKAYGAVNLAAGVRGEGWKASVFVNNLFDQRFALTRGRDAHWNINQTTTPPTDAVTWKPARDSFRYGGVRLQFSY
jgi:iron complex outermembrane receptor protein